MTRQLSGAALSSLLAQETGEAYLVLLTLTITDDTGGQSLVRFTSDSVATVQGVDTYDSYPFDITLPLDEEGKVSEGQLTVTNVDRQLIDDIRTYTAPIQVRIQIVLSSDPTDVMASFDDFVLRSVTYDALTISGTLVLESFLNEPVSRIMTAANYPGLF